MPLPRYLWLTSTLLVFALALARGESWQHTTWQGEPAWSSPHGDQLAIVSEDRERLIYFGGKSGESNVLSAPPKKPPSAKEYAPNWGGHRFWLGPQSRWNWPPLKEWEFSAAASVEVQGESLVIREPQLNPVYSPIERAYAWDGNRLRCTVRWKGGDRSYYGMHVVAIQIPAEFEVELRSSNLVPQGIVAVQGDTPNGISALPHRAVTVEKNLAHIRSGIATGKFGVSPQPLAVRRGAMTFILHPGPIQGTPAESPDFGYLTQIWVGDASSTFCELEQITPFLKPGPDGWCGSTVYFELRDNGAAVK